MVRELVDGAILEGSRMERRLVERWRLVCAQLAW